MKILLIGSGGREHALAEVLASSVSCTTLYCAPGNPGIFTVAKPASTEKGILDVQNHAEITSFCLQEAIDLVVIGPEAPLAAGLADDLRAEKIAVFGPSRAAAQLEASKGFAKDFMKKYQIPTAAYQRFQAGQIAEAKEFLHTSALPIVVKADGLAAGKGVTVCATLHEAEQALDEAFSGAFGSAGYEVVIEEFLYGEEASIFAICDGNKFISLAPAQDHKRAFDGDLGKNTGGMGAYAPARLVTPEILQRIESTIIQPTLDGMKAEGTPFIGCLFVGLMIHGSDAHVVEFNCRFGDPETQPVTRVFRGDFAKLLASAAHGKIDSTSVQSISEDVSCSVVLASAGYPDSYEKGKIITGIESAESLQGVRVFHAGTAIHHENLCTAGGRVLGVCASSASLAEAINLAYQAVDLIEFDGKFYRKDIGKKGL